MVAPINIRERMAKMYHLLNARYHQLLIAIFICGLWKQEGIMKYH